MVSKIEMIIFSKIYNVFKEKIWKKAEILILAPDFLNYTLFLQLFLA